MSKLRMIPLLVLYACTACAEDSKDDTETLVGLGLAASAIVPAQLPGRCNVQSGSRWVANAPLVSVSTNTTQSLEFLQSGSRAYSVVLLPAVAANTRVAFNFNPSYRPPFGFDGDIYLVYLTSTCPIFNTTPADFNVSGTTPITPTNYTFSGNAFTFTSSAAGRDFAIVAAPAAAVAGATVTRTNP